MNKKVLLLGSKGFLGRHLVYALKQQGLEVLVDFCRKDYRMITACQNVIHAAGKVDNLIVCASANGGIAFNKEKPFSVFYDNTLIALNCLKAAHEEGVKHVTIPVASCGYPDRSDTFLEKNFLEGIPNPTVSCHGLAKRNVVFAAEFAQAQYGLNVFLPCPPTLFGPGEKKDSVKTKVVGALVHKIVDAKMQGLSEITLWGTGKPLRDVMFAPDAAKLIARGVAEDLTVMLNLSSDQELSVCQLANTIARLADYHGDIRFDASKADGQYRKRLDPSLSTLFFPDFVPTPLEEALAFTINDYAVRQYGKTLFFNSTRRPEPASV